MNFIFIRQGGINYSLADERKMSAVEEDFMPRRAPEYYPRFLNGKKND